MLRFYCIIEQIDLCTYFAKFRNVQIDSLI